MKKNKPCPQCHAHMELKHTTLHFEREGFYADVENVSAYICSQCGSRSIPGTIAIKVGRTVEELFQQIKSVKPIRHGETPAFTGISFHKVA